MLLGPFAAAFPRPVSSAGRIPLPGKLALHDGHVRVADLAAGIEGRGRGAEDSTAEGQGGRAADQAVLHALQAHKVQRIPHEESPTALTGRLGEVQGLLHPGCEHRDRHLQAVEAFPDARPGVAPLPGQ